MDINVKTVKELCDINEALQNPEEFTKLLNFLKPLNPKIFVEIGVWTGGFAAVMKTFFPELRIIGIDITNPLHPIILPPNTAENIELLKENIEKYEIEYVVGSSQDQGILGRVVEKLGDQKADFLFIDGAHDYDSVKKDFEMWSPYARVVGFHDLHNEIGPWKFWLEVKDKYSLHTEFKADDGLGIGVLS